MKKKDEIVLFIAATIFFFVIFSGCDSGGGDGFSSSGGTKYLAKNIIFETENAKVADAPSSKKNSVFSIDFLSKAYAQSDLIDTETKIMAKNVIFENDDNSQIESDNVQDALEEISSRLSAVMVGAWHIQNYNQEIYHDSTGQVVINDDGTFDLTEGSFAAIGMGSGTAQDGFCNHTEENQTYQLYAEELVLFKHFNSSTENTAIPRLVKLRKNKMIFIGSGGCGNPGRQRISIFTRIFE